MIEGIAKVVFIMMLAPFVLVGLWVAAWISAAFFVLGINLLFKCFGIDINDDNAP